MSWFFTPHAKARAKERYGLDLTIRQLSFIACDCRDGRALMVRSYPDGNKVFCVRLGDVQTFPVMSPEMVIITFQPPDFLLVSTSKRHRAQKPKMPHAPRYGRNPEPYVRDRTPRYAQGAGE